MRTWLALSAMAWLGTACYSTQEVPPPVDEPDAGPQCIDGDGDGRGQGAACAGADCDDTDVNVWDTCGEDCGADPEAPGCPCEDDGAPVTCYGGPPGTLGVGACIAGVRFCREGAWSGCDDQRLPSEERCDEVDNDCNGVVDEGVQSACGNCDPACEGQCAGVGCDRVPTPSEGAEVAADGAIIVNRHADVQPHEIWLPNGQSGTVVRVDTQNLGVVGAYRVGPNRGIDAPVSVAMDGAGNAFVVNSNFSQQPTGLTKIWGSGCPDANRNGRIDTSTDEELLDWEEDECVAWNVEIEECDPRFGCGNGGVIALTERGLFAWVSLSFGSRIVEVETETGELTGRDVLLQGAADLVADADGFVWAAASGDAVVRFDVDDTDVESFPIDAAQAFLMHIDLGADGRVYGSQPLVFYDVGRDESATASWNAFDVAVDEDGNVWGLDNFDLRRYDADLEEFDSFRLPSFQLELAVDRDDQVWASTQFGQDILVVDARSGEEVARSIDGCNACLSAARLEGDPTGVRYRRAFGGGLADSSATQRFEMCVGRAQEPVLQRVDWETTGGSVRLSARRGRTQEELAAAPWVRLGSTPPDAGGVDNPEIGDGRFLEVRAELRSAEARLARVSAEWRCDGLAF